MLQVNKELVEAFRASTVFDARLNVYDGRVLTYEGLKIVDGAVNADRDQPVRRTLDCTIALHEWETVPLDVISSRVQVWVGFDIGGSPSVIPVGVFKIDTITRTNRGAISVSGSSFESYVVDNQYHDADWEIDMFPKGYNVVAAIKELILASFAEAEFEVMSRVDADRTLAQDFVLEKEQSYWDAVESLSSFLAADVYCTPTGKFRIARRPTMEGTLPVARVNEGADGVLITLNTSVTRDQTHNAVVATYQNADTNETLSAIAIDDDPQSPTYFGGSFGKRFTKVESTRHMNTYDELLAWAKVRLDEERFPERELDFSAIPNPALEPDDIVQVTMLDGTVENHMLKTLSIPLLPGQWSATTISTRAWVDELPDPDDPSPPADAPLPPDEPVPEEPPPAPDPPVDEEEEDAAGNPSVPDDPPQNSPTDRVATITACTFNTLYKLSDARRRSDLERLIREVRPSVIGLQESGSGIRSTYINVANARGYGFYQPMRTDANQRATTPIMWDTNIWDVDKKGKLQLSPKTKVGPSRGISVIWQAQKHIIWVRLRHKKTGTVWTFASVHLVAHKNHTRARKNLFLKQVSNLQAWMSKFDNRRLVVLGDFNAGPGDADLRPIRRVSRIQEAPSRRSGERIDHVYSRNAKPVRVRNLKGVNSDHFPVIATLKTR